MFAAKFDRELGKWRGVAVPKDGVFREDVLILNYAPEAKAGAFVNPRAVFEQRETAIRIISTWA